jgi:protoheme IX farnesyltransferase
MSSEATTIGVRPAGDLLTWRQTVAAYFALTKPRIIELLLVTTFPAMVVAAQGMPDIGLALATMFGGSLAAAGANTINCYIDRDIDAIMGRTHHRPLPAGLIAPERALAFGIALSAISFLFLSLTVNLLTAGLALSAILFYVFIYTVWLKRSTVENIVIGGAAAPLIMFAIVFLWTPPHVWALAIGYSNDYAKAGIPMLPVTHGAVEARRRSLVYAVVTAGVSMSLYLTGAVGLVYLALATFFGAAFVWLAWRQLQVASTRAAMRLFHFSITYLGIIFASMVVDQLVRI